VNILFNSSNYIYTNYTFVLEDNFHETYDYTRHSVIKITYQTVPFLLKETLPSSSHFLPYGTNISVTGSVVQEWPSVHMPLSSSEQNNTRKLVILQAYTG
jgi:hypothetical protein